MSDTKLYSTGIHWKVYVWPAIFLLVTSQLDSAEYPQLVLIFLVLGIFSLISAIVRRMTYELTLTSSSVILRKGILAKTEMRVPLDKVEAISVECSIVGRILGYGTFIYGNGTAATRFKNIAKPNTFRKKLFEQIESRGQFSYR